MHFYDGITGDNLYKVLSVHNKIELACITSSCQSAPENQYSLYFCLAAVDGHGYRIGKAIDWLKTNIASPLRVEELAARVQMSTPSFHQHFRQLAGMSPLRYQKWLRLNEAGRLMLTDHYDVTTAAYAVGYESLSHFSREYTRMFGESPKRDITVLRKAAGKI